VKSIMIYDSVGWLVGWSVGLLMEPVSIARITLWRRL